MASTRGNDIILTYDSPFDAELLARAIRESVFGDLTVKGFMASEATDVLRLLYALSDEAAHGK